MTWKQIFIVVVLISISTGCIPKSYIERLGIITAIGYDLAGENSLRGTMVMYQFDPSTTRPSQVVTSEATTSKGLRLEANKMTSHRLVSGQVRLKLFQDQLASRGMTKYMDTLERDAKVSDMGLLGVSEVPTADLLKMEASKEATNSGEYIKKMIEKNIEDNVLPDATLRTFIHDYYDAGIDPTLPMLTTTDGKAVISGQALFQNDKYVTKLSSQDIFYLLLLKNEYKDGQFQLQLPDEALKEFHKETPGSSAEGPLHVSLHEIDSDLTIDPKKGKPTEQSVNVTIEARLLEITKDVDLKNKKAIYKLEKEIEKKVKSDLEQFLEFLKENQVDPIGFGKIYNAKNRENRVTKENWRQQIPELNVSFDVKMKLLRHGTVE
ncbi:spore germination protein [Halobacillus alkaliphilus]|uniref:Spore germination protein n=1 Tax=Halobacillus alkaliphilus TaxID=396056 RepID=A0A1I2RZX3_9BACI|nr:Ger(x)C family spore germination protein [Halobacillus alkaliphilus]SFG46098.1 spore germination protein [Halobacillus alkaliphilus]